MLEVWSPSNDNICSGRAVAYAQECLESKGEFRGLLPIGEYNFGGQELIVKEDMDIHLEISPRLKRKLTEDKLQ